MAQHLASDPKNGPVAVYVAADGEFHRGSVHGQVMSKSEVAQAKIFELEYKDPKGPPSEKAPQIQAAMRAIAGATGTGSVDVVAHSGGCTDFRLYLQDRSGGDRNLEIGHAVFVGPASHGTVMGNVGDKVGGVMGLDRGGRELEVGSKVVDSLNASWDNQRGQVTGGVTIVGVTGTPTVGPHGITDGDGFMTADSIGMRGARTVFLHGADPTPIAHLKEIGYSGVIGAAEQAIGS
jgi:hypothetical protein